MEKVMDIIVKVQLWFGNWEDPATSITLINDKGIGEALYKLKILSIHKGNDIIKAVNSKYFLLKIGIGDKIFKVEKYQAKNIEELSTIIYEEAYKTTKENNLIPNLEEAEEDYKFYYMDAMYEYMEQGDDIYSEKFLKNAEIQLSYAKRYNEEKNNE